MNRLSSSEFALLQGTDLMVNFMRHRVRVPIERIDWLDDFMDTNCIGLYHTIAVEQVVILYCEHALDRENVQSILRSHNS